MRRKTCYPCGLITSIWLLIANPTSIHALESEPNDDITMADSIPCPAEEHGIISPLGDVDVFAFTLTEERLVLFRLSSVTPLTATLRDSGGASLGDATSGPTLPAGDYFIEIREPGDDGTAIYRFLLDCPGPYDEVEPNDTRATANPVSLDQPRKGSLRPNGGVDFWEFTLLRNGTVTGELDCTGDSILELQSSTGTVLASDDDSGPRRCSRVATYLFAGTYYFAVRPRAGTGEYPFDYSLLVSQDVDFGPFDNREPNNSIATAYPIPCYDQFTSVIGVTGDVDYYRFSLTEQSIVTILCQANIDSEMWLRDALGSQIAYNDDLAFGVFDSAIQQTLAAGTYHIEIRRKNDGGTDTYILSLGCQATGVDETEPNGTIATADPMTCGLPVKGIGAQAGDIDYWTFTISEPTILRIVLLAGSIADIGISLRDSNDSPIGSSASGHGAGQLVLRNFVGAGTYAVRVSRNALPYDSPYTLTAFCQAESQLDEVEPNNTLATASMISCGETRRGVISPASTDVDYWRFTISESTFVNAEPSAMELRSRSRSCQRRGLSSPRTTPLTRWPASRCKRP